MAEVLQVPSRREVNRHGIMILGPMLGRHPGLIPSQGETLASLFRTDGWHVVAASSHPTRAGRLLDIVKTVAWWGREAPIQVLNVFGGRSFLVEDIASALGRVMGQRIIMVLRGGALPDFISRFPRWSKRVIRRADVIVTPSEYLRRRFSSFGVASEVIPNVIPVESYPWMRRRTLRPRLFWMRTFHPIWNPEMAVRVLKDLQSDFPDASLVMAGENKYGNRVAVERIVAQLGLGAAVRFPGFLDLAGKVQEGSSADVFINTNRIDNMPVSVLEAMALGLPVVSTDVGGIRDLLEDGTTGLIVPDNDHAAMARAVRRLLSDQELAERLSMNGRALAEGCSWVRVRPRWERLIEQMDSQGL